MSQDLPTTGKPGDRLARRASRTSEPPQPGRGHGYPHRMNERASRGDTAWFWRQVRTRSREHREAMTIAAQQGWLSIMVGILRQELDSMIRII